MGIRVTWDRDDPQIIVVVFEGFWTLREFHTAGEQVMALAERCPRPVGVIMDTRAAPQLPADFIRHAASVVEGVGQTPRNNVVIYTVVGASAVIRAMYQAFFRVFGVPEVRRRVVLAASDADARSLIAARLAAFVETVYE